MLSVMAMLCAMLAAQPVYAQAWDQGDDTEDAQARAIIVTRNSFFLVDDLHFGDIIAGSTPSTIRLQPNGTRTRLTGNAVLVGTSHHPARFAGRGRRNQIVLISIASSSIQITGPGAPMTVNLFEIGSTPTVILTPSPASFTITATTGVFNFPVGARLAVGANQAGGAYSGTFDITLDYL